MFFIIIEFFLYIINSIIALLFYKPIRNNHSPDVSIILTFYKESEDIIKQSIESINNQEYNGNIYKIFIIDGIIETYNIVKKYADNNTVILNKEKRNGKVGSNNLGLENVKTEIFLLIDGDSIADKYMITNIIKEFSDPEVIAAGGNIIPLRSDNILSKMQVIEYNLSISLFKAGNSVLNTTNNISGAFGAFRKDYICKVGGWNKIKGEDLDLTIRLKNAYPDKKFKHSYNSTIYTDVPNNLGSFIRQRMRWDRDFIFLVCKYLKNIHNMNSVNMLYFLIYNIYLCLINPMMIFLYFFMIWYTLNMSMLIFQIIITYIIYCILTITIYLFYMILYKSNNYQLIPYILLFPVYKVFSGFITMFAFSYELLSSGNDKYKGYIW